MKIDYYQQWLSRRGRRGVFGDVPKRILFEPSNKERHEEYGITDLYVIARKEWLKFAISKVNQAVRAGKLPHISRCKCRHCGCQAKQYHHYNGYKPEYIFDVEPVCMNCHRTANKTRKKLDNAKHDLD